MQIVVGQSPSKARAAARVWREFFSKIFFEKFFSKNFFPKICFKKLFWTTHRPPKKTAVPFLALFLAETPVA